MRALVVSSSVCAVFADYHPAHPHKHNERHGAIATDGHGHDAASQTSMSFKGNNEETMDLGEFREADLAADRAVDALYEQMFPQLFHHAQHGHVSLKASPDSYPFRLNSELDLSDPEKNAFVITEPLDEDPEKNPEKKTVENDDNAGDAADDAAEVHDIQEKGHHKNKGKSKLKGGTKNSADAAKNTPDGVGFSTGIYEWDSQRCSPLIGDHSAVPEPTDGDDNPITGCDLWAKATDQFVSELRKLTNQTDIQLTDLKTNSKCDVAKGICTQCFENYACSMGQLCLSQYYTGLDANACTCFMGDVGSYDISMIQGSCDGGFECRDPAEDSPMALKNQQMSSSERFSDLTFRLGVCERQTSSSCFSGDSLVATPAGPVAMRQLEIGDEVFTASGVESVVGWMHRATTAHAKFIELYHSDGMLTLTPDHVIFLSDGSAIPARDVKIGMQLATLSGSSEVMRVALVVGHGIYSPMTQSSTIVVDGVLCSTLVDVAYEFTEGLAQIFMSGVSRLAQLFSSAPVASVKVPVQILS